MEEAADKASKLKDLEKLPSEIDDLVREGRLHPNHHQVVRLKHLFLDKWIANGGGGSVECSKIAIHFSEDLLNFYHLIDPGETEVKKRLLALRAAATIKFKFAERGKRLQQQQ